MVVEEVDKQKYLDVYEDKEFASLGSGEQESILLALASPGSSLLMSDNKARRITKGKGINVINIPAFLLACKLAALLSKEEIKQIIQDLKQKDYYEFKTSEREELLR
jgi:predicted nucleic acid-binding protein